MKSSRLKAKVVALWVRCHFLVTKNLKSCAGAAQAVREIGHVLTGNYFRNSVRKVDPGSNVSDSHSQDSVRISDSLRGSNSDTSEMDEAKMFVSATSLPPLTRLRFFRSILSEDLSFF